MQLTSLFAAAAALSGIAMAAPAPETSTIMGVGDNWTILNMKRTCNDADTQCTYTFGIGAKVSYPASADRFPVACTHVVKSANGVPASEMNSSQQSKCAWFTVQSGWSSQGFTTLSVIDYPKNWIVYPSYSDAELDTEMVVKPNRAYPVNNLP